MRSSSAQLQILVPTMLREIDRNIWAAEQPLRYFGLSVGTRMTVIRLENRELLVISPITLSNEIIDQLSHIGTVKHIVAPNLYHYFFAAEFKAHYQNATFWAVSGLKAKRPDLLIDRTIEAVTGSLWDGIEHIRFDGFKTLGSGGFESLNECVFFHADSHTLILTDTAFHFDESFPFLTRLASRATGDYKSLSPSIFERIATIDKERVRDSIDKVMMWDFDRVIMAHGSIIEQRGREKLKKGYEKFLF